MADRCDSLSTNVSLLQLDPSPIDSPEVERPVPLLEDESSEDLARELEPLTALERLSFSPWLEWLRAWLHEPSEQRPTAAARTYSSKTFERALSATRTTAHAAGN